MIVDAHTHIFPRAMREDRGVYFKGEPAFELLYNSPKASLAGREDLLRHMDAAGVQWAVVFGFPWAATTSFQRHNDYILDSMARYPDRLVGFGCFSPLSPEGPKEAERCLASGLAGLGELAFYDSDLDPGPLREVLSVAAGFNAPVMLHTNEPVGHAYPGKTPMTLNRLYRIIQETPEIRFILAHWGGGLFFYALMRKDVREVLNNTWFDTAASPYLYSPEIYRVACEIVGEERILLGSDYPLLNPERYLREMDQAGLSRRAIEKISGVNAANLLGVTLHR